VSEKTVLSILGRGQRRSVASALLLIATALVGGALDLTAQDSVRIVPRSLDQLTSEARLIVHGYVTSVKVEPHPQLQNLMTMLVSVKVKEVYKGGAQSSLVFRQYVWDLNRNGKALQYRTGEEVILLLGPVSRYGLSSPVGLDQGLFQVSQDAKGRPIAINGRGNLGLFDRVAERAHSRGLRLAPPITALASQHRNGPVLVSDLKTAIIAFAGAN
jgi:hypothetical protein